MRVYWDDRGGLGCSVEDYIGTYWTVRVDLPTWFLAVCGGSWMLDGWCWRLLDKGESSLVGI